MTRVGPEGQTRWALGFWRPGHSGQLGRQQGRAHLKKGASRARSLGGASSVLTKGGACIKERNMGGAGRARSLATGMASGPGLGSGTASGPSGKGKVVFFLLHLYFQEWGTAALSAASGGAAALCSRGKCTWHT